MSGVLIGVVIVLLAPWIALAVLWSDNVEYGRIPQPGKVGSWVAANMTTILMIAGIAVLVFVS